MPATTDPAHLTVDPAHMEAPAEPLPQARYVFCPQLGHLALYDDAQTYFTGLIQSVRDVDADIFKTRGQKIFRHRAPNWRSQ